MSAAREKAQVARAKLEGAERLIHEAYRELVGALPPKHALLDDANDLLRAAKRVHLLTVQVLPRIP